MRRAVTIAQKQEAVALAAVVGAVEAAERLGWDPRSVRKWSDEMGNRPELDAPTDELQQLYSLAVARVTTDVVEGKIKGQALMTVVGIARDKLDRAARWRERMAKVEAARSADTEPSDTPLTDAAHARFSDWMESLELTERRALYRYLRFGADIEAAGDLWDARPESEKTDAEGAADWERWLATCQADLAQMVEWGIAHEKREQDRVEQCKRAGRWLDDETCDLLIEAEEHLAQLEATA